MLPAYAGIIPVDSVSYARAVSAPRIRGDDPRPGKRVREEGDVLPAYAGMIPKVFHVRLKKEGAPHIRGDDPPHSQTAKQANECSPHTRG